VIDALRIFRAAGLSSTGRRVHPRGWGGSERRESLQMKLIFPDCFLQCRRGGDLCDLQLLVPEPGLTRLDLVVQQAGLVIQFKALLAQLHQACCGGEGGEET
jgi:hypothetical protein